MDKLWDFLIDAGWAILGTLIILVVGFFLVGRILDIVDRIFFKKKLDATASKFLLHISEFVLKLFVVIVAISQLGINTVSISAAIGGLAVAVVLALQGSLTNFAGGILILIFKPYKIGDYITTPNYNGTVEDIQILTTVLRTADNMRVMVPHSVVLSGAITNYGSDPLRVSISFFTSLSVKTEDVKRILLGVLEEGDYLAEKEPSCIILSETRDALEFSLRFWVANDAYWTLGAKYKAKGREALVKNSIELPVIQFQTIKE